MQGGASDCNRCPLLWSDRPTWTLMHPPPKLTSSHCIRDWWFPYVWRCPPSTVTDVPVPTPVKPTPKGSDSKIMPQVDSGLAWSPSTSPTRLSWGGSMGSYDFSHGYPPEHPQRMRWRLQVMCSGSGCLQHHMHLAEGVDISSPSDAIGQWTEWLPQTTHRTESWLQDHRGYGTGKYPSMSSFLMTMAIIYFDAEYFHSIEDGPCHWLKGGLYPCSTK